MKLRSIHRIVNRKLQLCILSASFSLGFFSSSVSEAALSNTLTWAGANITNVTASNTWTVSPAYAGAWTNYTTNSGVVTTNTGTNSFNLSNSIYQYVYSNSYSAVGPQTFSYMNSNAGCLGVSFIGYSNVTVTNVGSFRLDTGGVLATNAGGGRLTIWNTNASQLTGNTAFQGNMGMWLNNLANHSSTARIVYNSNNNVAINYLVVSTMSQTLIGGANNISLTLEGTGTMTVPGAILVGNLTNTTGTSNNAGALIVKSGTINIATTNAANRATVGTNIVNSTFYGWNSGLVITNSGSVFVAGQNSLGIQAYNIKIGTTNRGTTTFGVFGGNEWATNSASTVSVTNNFDIINASGATNIFQALADKSLILSGVITNANANGTLIFRDGAITLSGSNTALSLPLVVTNGGTLVASTNNALGSGSLTVANGATNVIAASITKNNITNNGSVVVMEGGNLTATNVAGAGTLSVGTTGAGSAAYISSLSSGTNNVGSVLQLTGRGNLSMNFGTQIKSDNQVNVTGTSNSITLVGAITQPGTYDLVVAGSSLSVSGSIALTGTAFGGETLALGSPYTGPTFIYTFTNSPTALQLVVELPKGGSDLVFGFSQGAWNTNTTTMNWQAVTGSTNLVAFRDGDNALFTNSATVNVNGGPVKPITLTFSNSANQTVNLSGSSVDATAMNVNGGGNVTLSNNVTVSAAETVSSGTLQIASGATNSVGSLVLSGGTISGSGTLTNSSSYDMQAGTANIVLNGTNGLTKSTTGTVTLGASNAYSGATTVSGGVLQYGVNNAIASGAVSVSGGTLALGNYSDEVGAVTLSSGSITGTNGVLTGASYQVESGLVSAILGGTGALVKTNSGTVVLSGANTYSGATTINSGVLNIQNSSGLGATNAGTTVGTGSVLELQGGIAVGAEALTLNGSGISSGGALRNIGGANTYSGPVTLGSASRINSDSGTLILNNAADITGATFGLTLGGAGNININSVIGTTTGTLTKDGTGTATLSAANTYSGATTISNGSLVFGVSNAIATNNTVTVGGGSTLGVLNLGGFNNTNALAFVVINNGVITNGTINSAGGYRITNTSGAALTNTISANLGGTGGLTNNVTNSMTLLSGSNSYTGLTRIEMGTLQLGNSFALGAGGTDHNIGTQLRGGILDLNGQTNINETLVFADANSYVTNSSTNTATWSGSLYLSNSTANNFSVGSGKDIVVTGSITNGSSTRVLNKNGDGVLTFSNANTNTGTINVNAGTLRMGNAAALGSSSAISNVTVASGATLDLNGYTASSARVFNIAGVGVGGNGAIYNGSTSNATFSNAIAMTSNATIGTLGNLTLSGPIMGGLYYSTPITITNTNTFVVTTNAVNASNVVAGIGLTKVGSGTLFLTGSNSYSGGTIISNGAISISNSISLGTNSAGLVGSLTLAGTSPNTASLISTLASGTMFLGDVTMNGNAILSLSNAYTQFSVVSMALTGSANQISIGTFGWDAGTVATPNTYNLLSSSSAITGGNTMSLLVGGTTIQIGSSGTVGRNTYEFVYNDVSSATNSYAVKVSGGAFDLFWNGSENNDWNTTATNWNQAASSDNIAFVTGDNVNFTAQSRKTITVDSGGVTAATMRVAGPLTLTGGNVNAALTVATGGSLIVEGTVTPTGTLRIDEGTFQIGSGGANGALGNANEINITNDGSLIVNLNTNYTLSNQVTGNGFLVQRGTGTTVLANSNTYSGQTTVLAGTLQIGSAAVGGSSATPGSGDILVNSNATLAFNRINIYTNANNISGAGSVSQLGNNFLELGGNNTFTGGLYLNTNSGGVMYASSNANLGSGTIYAVSSNSRIGLSTLGLTPTSASMRITNRMSTSLTGTNTDVLAFTPKQSNTYSIYLDGPISGAGWLKIGSSAVTAGTGVFGPGTGNLYVNNTNNDYSGGTELGNGRIIIGKGSALGSGAILFSSAVLGNTILQVTNDTTLLQNFTLGASASNSTALAVIDTTNTVTLSGVISNRSSNQFGSLVKVGTGTVILPNTNTYTGGTTISDGALIVSGALTGGSLIKIVDSASSRLVLSNTTALASTTSLIGDSALDTTGTLELAAAGDYTLNSYGTTNTAGGNMYFTNSSRSNSTLTFTNATNYITISSAGSGGRALANNSADLTINFNGAVDIGSSVSDEVIFGGVGNFVVNGSVFNTNTGARTLIKTGSGTLSLRGPNNTNFTTEVRGGNLNVVSTNLSAQITTNTVAIAFSNGVAAGTYKVLPGALTGAYTSTNFSGLSNGLSAAFNLTSGQVLVSVVPPTNLSYSASTVIGTVDTAISNVTPTVTGEGITYSISPTLPFGLSISPSTGVIRGTPLVSSPSQEYTVTARNSGGATTAKVTIMVNLAEPSGLSYSSSNVIGTVGTAISNVTPTVTGEGITYSISPVLPAGLAISSSTGVISGTPSVSSPSTEYTVTARNSGGATTAKVTITVNPSGMTFASWSTNATLTSDLLYKYAFGAPNKNSEAQKMTSTVTGTNLILTAVVRTNDTAHLTITAKTAASLAGPWSTPASLTESIASSQSGVSDGLVRKDFKVDRGSDTKRFLKLEVLHTQ